MSETEYTGPERRRETHLTDEQIEKIADKAATKAVEKMTRAAFEGIGRSVVSKFFTAVGIITLAAYFWLTAMGKVPPPSIK